MLESEFTDDDGHKNLLPYAPGSDDGRRADALMRLERALFSRWMQWITSSWNDASAQSVYCEVLDEVDAELGAGGGPYFMGEEFTLVDIAYEPFLERMAASILYYKGVKIEGNGGRWPNVDTWFAAMASRKVYRGIKSDYYTTAHDLPPQLGGCAENGENAIFGVFTVFGISDPVTLEVSPINRRKRRKTATNRRFPPFLPLLDPSKCQLLSRAGL